VNNPNPANRLEALCKTYIFPLISGPKVVSFPWQTFSKVHIKKRPLKSPKEKKKENGRGPPPPPKTPFLLPPGWKTVCFVHFNRAIGCRYKTPLVPKPAKVLFKANSYTSPYSFQLRRGISKYQAQRFPLPRLEGSSSR